MVAERSRSIGDVVGFFLSKRAALEDPTDQCFFCAEADKTPVEGINYTVVGAEDSFVLCTECCTQLLVQMLQHARRVIEGKERGLLMPLKKLDENTVTPVMEGECEALTTGTKLQAC